MVYYKKKFEIIIAALCGAFVIGAAPADAAVISDKDKNITSKVSNTTTKKIKLSDEAVSVDTKTVLKETSPKKSIKPIEKYKKPFSILKPFVKSDTKSTSKKTDKTKVNNDAQSVKAEVKANIKEAKTNIKIEKLIPKISNPAPISKAASSVSKNPIIYKTAKVEMVSVSQMYRELGITELDVEGKQIAENIKNSRPEGVAPWQKVGSPYQISGKWYIPQHEPDYDETGEASWYGKQFDGKSTANGEIFDMNEITIAHPTLPMPSYVEVTNLENGRSVIARVNDRGPYAHNRLVDVSMRAAELLGFKDKGKAKVRVKFIGYAPPAKKQIKQQFALEKLNPSIGDKSVAPVKYAQKEIVKSIIAAPVDKSNVAEPVNKSSTAQPVDKPIIAEPIKQEKDEIILANTEPPIIKQSYDGLTKQIGSFMNKDFAEKFASARPNYEKAQVVMAETTNGIFYRVIIAKIINDEAQPVNDHNSILASL